MKTCTHRNVETLDCYFIMGGIGYRTFHCTDCGLWNIAGMDFYAPASKKCESCGQVVKQPTDGQGPLGEWTKKEQHWSMG